MPGRHLFEVRLRPPAAVTFLRQILQGELALLDAAGPSTFRRGW